MADHMLRAGLARLAEQWKAYEPNGDPVDAERALAFSGCAFDVTSLLDRTKSVRWVPTDFQIGCLVLVLMSDPSRSNSELLCCIREWVSACQGDFEIAQKRGSNA